MDSFDKSKMLEMKRSEQAASVKFPITSFEHYMLADDRATHSMTCHIRFWFRGRFDPAIFTQALQKTLMRHPIFQMTIDGSPNYKTKNIHWIPSERLVMPFISWQDQTIPIEAPPNGFAQNLYKEIGLRIWIRDSHQPSPTQTMLLVQFHHSVCDGIGLFQFMEDLMIYYGECSGVTVPALRTIDPDMFSKRGTFGLTSGDWSRRRKIDFKRALKFFINLASPVIISKQNQFLRTTQASLFASERLLLPKEYLDLLRSDARQKNVSVNDLLIRNLFQSLQSNGWLSRLNLLKTRIAVAMSLRGELESNMSAANIVSMVFLDRSKSEVHSPKLLNSIVQEMSEIKLQRLGLVLPRVISTLGRAPLLLKFFLKIPICSATAVLTNLGRPFADSKLLNTDGKLSVGELTLESLETLPPVRPKTRMSLSVNYYASALSITVRYDSTILDRLSALKFLHQFVDQIKSPQSEYSAGTLVQNQQTITERDIG